MAETHHKTRRHIARIDDGAERALAELAEIQAQEQRALEQANRIKRRIDAVIRRQSDRKQQQPERRP